MEQALSAPDQPTDHFAPINVIQISGNVIGSRIQQGAAHSTQTVSFPGNETEAIQEFIRAARAAIASPGFDRAFATQAEPGSTDECRVGGVPDIEDAL